MPDSMMFSGDAYVVLESNQPEQFLSAAELLEKLQRILAERQQDLPRDLQQFEHPAAQAKYLLETGCELNLDPGEFLQWYVVRLEK